MTKHTFFGRVIGPFLYMALPMAIAWGIYFNASMISNPTLHRWVAFISGLVMMLTVALGVLAVYPKAYARGAGPVERIFAGLLNSVDIRGVRGICGQRIFYHTRIFFLPFESSRVNRLCSGHRFDGNLRTGLPNDGTAPVRTAPDSKPGAGSGLGGDGCRSVRFILLGKRHQVFLLLHGQLSFPF
jgi:hypothetical protein